MTGENGILTKANTAKEEHKIAQYKEELNLIITEEVTERKTEVKKEPMIESLDKKITKKEWVAKTSREKAEGDSEEYLIVESKEGYEFIIEVNNEKETAKIIQESKTPGEKYTITYDPNGGTGEAKTVEVISGFYKILENNTYTREDYIFGGWCEEPEPNEEAKIYLEGSKYKPEKDVTLYAVWTYNVATITFDANEGTGKMEDRKVTKGDTAKLPVNTFTREDYDFVKWNTKADGTGIDYEDSAIIKMEDNITLYAIWKERPIVADFVKKYPSRFYGSIVTNYSAKIVDNKDYNDAVAKWRIFYADDSNIYLIANDYIRYSYMPRSKSSLLYKNTDYKVSFVNTVSDYPNGSTHITDTRIKTLNNDYFNAKKYSSTSNAMKAVAFMLDTNVWSVYAGTYADYAIAGPSIEMFVNSYSQKYNANLMAQAVDENGYRVMHADTEEWVGAYERVLDTTDNLYAIATTTKSSDLWISSPSYNSASLCSINSAGTISSNQSANYGGFRPVVCLKSDVQLIENADKTYSLYRGKE